MNEFMQELKVLCEEAAVKLKEIRERMSALEQLPAETELIQGYTAEQWQEIIDGGYLCEFSFSPVFNDIVYGKLENYSPTQPKSNRFKEHNNVWWPYCRPAQIKGVMRPIFSTDDDPRPSDRMFYFFDSGDKLVWAGPWPSNNKIKIATKYIEL